MLSACRIETVNHRWQIQTQFFPVVVREYYFYIPINIVEMVFMDASTIKLRLWN